MTALGAAALELQAAEGQVDLVMHDDQPMRIHFEIVHQSAQGLPRLVHVALADGEDQLRAVRQLRTYCLGTYFGAAVGRAEPVEKLIEDHLPDIVPGTLIAGPGVPEARYQPGF